MKRVSCILCLLLGVVSIQAQDNLPYIISDIYQQLAEDDTPVPSELEEELLELAEHPIDLNTATADDLKRLYFLSDRQIDDILLYCYEHPMDSLYELQLIQSLHDYDIRNLTAFVCVRPSTAIPPLYAREVFARGSHELLSRLDLRNIETAASDPVYCREKYAFNYANRVQWGLQLVRPTGTDATQLQPGAYVQLNNIGCAQTIVLGDFQASFGQGLVISNSYHGGKSAMALNAATRSEGLRKYTGTSEQGLRGVGSTLRFEKGEHIIRATLLYSWTQPNDSLHQHLIGTNLSWRFRQLKLGLTACEYIYSDSVRYFRNSAYNQRYIRSDNQLVLGANWRYVYRWLDFYGELAAAQNTQWGIALETGLRCTPVQDLGIIALYRYYSPWFDNPRANAFSEFSRIQDENGLYLGLECTRWKNWQINVWGDIFYFQHEKYQIPYSPSWGYDAMADIRYVHSTQWSLTTRIRAREKAQLGKYSMLCQFDWQQDAWRLRTRCDGTISAKQGNKPNLGIQIYQDIEYRFTRTPITLQVRLQGFDIRCYDNRVYCYENDVLYSFSQPSIYGRGGRAYINMRWQILPALALYLKLSETVWNRTWAIDQGKSCQNQTDIHLLLRAKL